MKLFSLLLAFVAALLLTTTASANLIDDTPPPAPTEVVDPYGDGEDENGLIPDDNGEDIDEELNSQPFAESSTRPVEDSTNAVEVVTRLPDTGSGSADSSSLNPGIVLLGMGLGFILAGIFVGKRWWPFR
jgi:hypothetical protein